MEGPRLGHRTGVGAAICDRAAFGGHVAAVAQWSRGLQRLGHEVTVIERAARLDGVSDDVVRELGAVVARAEPGGDRAYGPLGALFNLTGFIPEGQVRATRRVYVDIDPGYPQMWKQLGLADVLAGHDSFVTVAENMGRDSCSIPSCGVDWITTSPPVDVHSWKPAFGGRGYTSVATWRNHYGSVQYQGATYGSRVHEFRKFIELPRLVDVELELALDIHPEETRDLEALAANGWRLVDPRQVAGSPASYRRYVCDSRAEFSVAQNMYVATRSGWLSDRSLCYLASGKPVLAQDTGFSDNYPVGEGLLAFSTVEEAAAGVEEIERNYERHCRAARELAEEHFDSDKVLSRLLERLGVEQ